MGEDSRITAGVTATEVTDDWAEGVVTRADLSKLVDSFNAVLDDQAAGHAKDHAAVLAAVRGVGDHVSEVKGSVARREGRILNDLVELRVSTDRKLADIRFWAIAALLGVCLSFVVLLVTLTAGVGKPQVQAPPAAQPTVIVLPAPAAK